MQVQLQMQTQAAPQMMDAGPQLQPQMQPPYMLVAGCGPTVAALGQQLHLHLGCVVAVWKLILILPRAWQVKWKPVRLSIRRP